MAKFLQGSTNKPSPFLSRWMIVWDPTWEILLELLTLMSSSISYGHPVEFATHSKTFNHFSIYFALAVYLSEFIDGAPLKGPPKFVDRSRDTNSGPKPDALLLNYLLPCRRALYKLYIYAEQSKERGRHTWRFWRTHQMVGDGEPETRQENVTSNPRRPSTCCSVTSIRGLQAKSSLASLLQGRPFKWSGSTHSVSVEFRLASDR